jgi:hypothetical protein
MTVEDRVRAATRARVELVHEIRPLEIPERLPRRGLRAARPRRHIGWLAPVTAAAVVVALAIALVSVRQAAHDGASPGPAQVSSAATIPRYAVFVSPGRPGGPSPAAATVTDTRTGTVLARVRPPAHRAFAGVTGAADDRTFVVDTTPASGPSGHGTHVWYQLRINTVTGHPASLTRLPITGLPVSAQIQGVALSPDARTLAVLFRPGTPNRISLRTYSLATGHALRTWTAPAPKATVELIPISENVAALSWVGEHTLAFRYPVNTWPDYLRMLNVASKGRDLVKASRSVMADPGDQHHCATLLTATDGRTVACGTAGNATGGCVKEEPEFTLWSTATGKVTRVLYRYNGTCDAAFASVLWAGPHGTVIGAIVAFTLVGKHEHAKLTAGLISHGKFTPLHIPGSINDATIPGGFAF